MPAMLIVPMNFILKFCWYIKWAKETHQNIWTTDLQTYAKYLFD
jgi:hypothetical protein